MKKSLAIKSNVRYNELKQYKKKFLAKELFGLDFILTLENVPFKALLRYGRTEQYSKYDREYKFKIYLEGTTSLLNEIKLIERLYELSPSKPILLMEILFTKEKQELIKHENGDLEYHFTFLQY